MPHVSRQKLDTELLEKLLKELETLFVHAKEHEAAKVIHVLLTPTERIMLAKRLAAALMFSEGCSQYEVWNTLKLSPSTAQRLSHAYESGIYDHLIKIVKRNAGEVFWRTLEVILQAGLPPRGKNRWEWLNQK